MKLEQYAEKILSTSPNTAPRAHIIENIIDTYGKYKSDSHSYCITLDINGLTQADTEEDVLWWLEELNGDIEWLNKEWGNDNNE